MSKDHVGLQGDQLFRTQLHLSAGGCKAVIDADVAAFRPSEAFEPLPESGKPCFPVRIVFGQPHQHTDASHALGLLRARCERPSRHRAAAESNEIAASHSSYPSS
jgi:hypothetical protein